jgi:hypothetical protein
MKAFSTPAFAQAARDDLWPQWADCVEKLALALDVML